MKLFSRLERIFLLIICLARIVQKGPATKKPEKISRIMIVPTGKLGDLVCNTPVIFSTRKSFPNAKIIAAGNSKLCREVFSESGLVDEYLDLVSPGAVSRVKNAAADVALVTGPAFSFVAKVFAAGVPFVVAPSVVGGFSPAETRLYKILKKFIETFPYRIDAYAPRERLKVMEKVGVFSDDTRKHLGFSSTAEEKIKKFFSENKINPEKDFVVAISPTAGNKIKEWPEDRFAEVADHLVTKYQAKIIILGGPNDKEKVKKTASSMKSQSGALEVTNLNIDELKALVSKLSLFVAVDTGPIYVAEAFGVATVDIVGPVDERVQPPQGAIHINVVPPRRSAAELSILNARFYNKSEAVRQTLSITALHVINAVDSLLNSIKNK